MIKKLPNYVLPDYVYAVSERQDQHSIRQPKRVPTVTNDFELHAVGMN